jgi:hypothetical protein
VRRGADGDGVKKAPAVTRSRSNEKRRGEHGLAKAALATEVKAGLASREECKPGSPPEVAETIRRQLGVAHRVLDVLIH